MNNIEPGDIETLNLVVRHVKLDRVEYIRLAVVPENVREGFQRASFCMVQFVNGRLKECQSFIDVEEIDEMISALIEAKRRILEYSQETDSVSEE